MADIDLTEMHALAERAANAAYDRWHDRPNRNAYVSDLARRAARAAVDTVAPLLTAKARQQAADEIFAHADRYAPRTDGEAPSAARRHLHIAARIAAGMPTPEQATAKLAELASVEATEHHDEEDDTDA